MLPKFGEGAAAAFPRLPRLIRLFRSGKPEKQKNGLLWFTLYDQTFLSEAGTINYPASLMSTKAIGKGDNNTVLFLFFFEVV